MPARLTALLAAGLAAACALAAAPASAQTSASTAQISAIADRLARLERDLRDMQAELYGGSAGRPAAGRVAGVQDPASGEAPSADVAVRISQIERELQQLTGQIEELNFRTQRNADAIEAIQLAMGGKATGLTGRSSSDGGPTALGPSAGGPAAKPAAVDVTLPENGDQAYQYVDSLIFSADYERAASALELFIEKFPDHPKTPEAKFRLGEIYLVLRVYASAAEVFLDYVRNHGDHERIEQGYFKLGQAFARLDKKDEACQVLDTLLSRFPNTDQITRSRARNEQRELGC